MIWRHETLNHLLPYLLLANIVELLLNSLLPFFKDSWLRWFQASFNVCGSSKLGFVLPAMMAQSIKEFKFLLVLFPHAAFSTILLTS